LAAAGPSQGAVVIDDFLVNDGVTGLFPTVEALTYGTAPVEANGFHNASGHVIGGERDVRTRVTNTQTFVGDGGAGIVRAQAGISNGFVTLGIGVDFGAAGDFLLQYDGFDAAIGLGGGLNYDAAAAGDGISVSAIYNLFVHGNTYGTTDIFVRLTDMSGQSASLTRTLGAGLVGFQTLNYGFAAFEAANSQFDLRHIRAIELGGDVRNDIPFTGFLNLTGFGIMGAAYTPGNQIGGDPGPGPGVPEPRAWALMIAGFGLAGASLRRRRLRAA
jgi:hypothetical protein